MSGPKPVISRCGHGGGLVSLQLAKFSVKGSCCSSVEVWVVKDEHGVLVHPRVDRRHLLATDRPG